MQIHTKYPLKIKIPEDNGGALTGQDMFPGMNYFTRQDDVIINDELSVSLSNNFNIYSTLNAPRLIRYIPSLEIFSSVFYKGIYIYNPSVENDGVDYETERRNIVFSINGGSNVILDEVSTPISGTIIATSDTVISESDLYSNVPVPSDLAAITTLSVNTYYQVDNWQIDPYYNTASDTDISGYFPDISQVFRWNGNKWVLEANVEFSQKTYYEIASLIDDINETQSLSKIDKTSTNGNVNISIVGEEAKNLELSYFNIDGSSEAFGEISSKRFVPANSGLQIPNLLPGEFYGVYLKIETLFDADSKPVDYSFFNLTYENFCPDENPLCFNQFSARDNIPGISDRETPLEDYYVQSFAIKLNTRLAPLNRNIGNFVDVMYNNYPPFFTDYRESDNL